MRHLTEDQATYIFKARLDTHRPKSWKQIGEELDITPSKLRADRKTKPYLELAFAYCAQYSYGTEHWTLKQAGCLHPDTATMKEVWHGSRACHWHMTDADMVFNDGGRTGFDLHRCGPVGKVGDCAIRAIAIALDRDYGAVWNAMNPENLKLIGHSVDNGTAREVSQAYLNDAGWVKITLDKREDARYIAAKLTGERAVLGQYWHYVAAVDGQCHDTWLSNVTMEHLHAADTTWRYGTITDNDNGTISVLFDATVRYLYVAADRVAAVRQALRDNLTQPQPMPVPAVEDRLPLDCEVKRYSDAYDLLMDEAVERVMEDADIDAEGFDDYFDDDVRDAFDALIEERAITIV